MTYEEHKAAVDEAYPTPTLVWYLHVDNVSHEYDDQVVADAFVTFDGHEYEFEVSYSAGGEPGAYSYHARRVGGEDEGRRYFGGAVRTWAAAKPEIQALWAGRCESTREVIAHQNQIKEILMADGITARTGPVATEATATLAGLMPHSATVAHWTLAPAFAPDTLAYAFDSSNDTFVPVAELGFAGQMVFWKHGSDAYAALAPVITLAPGENVITITVVSADGQHVKTYTLTVTR